MQNDGFTGQGADSDGDGPCETGTTDGVGVLPPVVEEDVVVVVVVVVLELPPPVVVVVEFAPPVVVEELVVPPVVVDVFDTPPVVVVDEVVVVALPDVEFVTLEHEQLEKPSSETASTVINCVEQQPSVVTNEIMSITVSGPGCSASTMSKEASPQ